MQIQGKVFVVTGGASGLGEGTARILASQGGQVVIADREKKRSEACLFNNSCLDDQEKSSADRGVNVNDE